MTVTVTVSEARVMGSELLVDRGFTRGYNGLDIATWGHPDGRIGRLVYVPAFGDPVANFDRIRKIQFQGPAINGVLPMPIDLIEL